MRLVDQFEEEMLLDKIFKKYQELYEAEGSEIKVNNDFKYGFVLSMLHSMMTIRLTESERQEEYLGMEDHLYTIRKRVNRQKRLNKKGK
jgi:hypothetical protein